MTLYEWGTQYLLVPHVVSAVQRSERELTLNVVVRDVAGQSIQADVTAQTGLTAVERGAALPVREEVVLFLRGLLPQLEVPGVSGTANPRKSIQFQEKAPDGADVVYQIHFGGYERHMWSPIKVGVTFTAQDTTARDAWYRLFHARLDSLPADTTVSFGGPRTVNVLKEVVWTSPDQLNKPLADALAAEFAQFVRVTRDVLALSTAGAI
jgi:hypothetical protein